MLAGIRVSDDKLLQSRVFAYSDAQRYRLRANYQLLPVNAPKCPYKNNHYEGLMSLTQRGEEVDLTFSSICNLKLIETMHLQGAAQDVGQTRCTLLCCAVLCCAVLCCAVLCCAVLCCAVLCCAVLCCAVLCCAVLCCAVLCCIILNVVQVN